MPPSVARNLAVAVFAAVMLTGCGMPTEPDGIHEEGFTRLGEKMQEQGDDAGAVDFYQRALQRRPGDMVALKHMGAIFEAHGNVEAAADIYRQALAYAPDDVDLLNAEGRTLIRMGRADDARDIFQRAVDEDRHDVKALNGLGVALDYLGQHEDAQKQYQLALAEQPESLSTLNNIAHSYVLAGKYEDAVTLLEPHAKDKTATPALRQNLAEAYGMAGMYVDAERLARVDLKPQDVKRNMAYYKARRAKLAPEPKFAADLGAYPTREMAEAEAQKVMDASSDSSVKVTVDSEVDAIGGTPHFIVRATGFQNSAGVNTFCALLLKNELGCKAAKK